MKVIIIGAGIGGLTTALALKHQGIAYEVFEEAPALKALGAGLGIGENAVKVLEMLGLGKELPWSAQALKGMRILTPAGKLLSESSRVGYTIHRADLHTLLLRHLDTSLVHLGKRCVRVEDMGECVTAHFEDGSLSTADFLIAADGIKSRIRRDLVPASAPRYAGYTCFRSVTDAPRECGDLEWASETWGPKGRFGIVPLRNRRIYWYACVNAAEDDARVREWKTAELKEVFGKYHAPIPAILSATKDETVIWGNIADVAPLPRHVYGRIVLLGDAGHATTPNLGQGACQAMEGAVVLAKHLSEEKDPALALQHYEKDRLERTRKVVTLSRRIGWAAQWSHPVPVALRNLLMRMTPDFMVRAQTSFLFRPFM